MAIDISRLQRAVLDDAIRKARALQQRGCDKEAAAAWDKAAHDAESFAANATSDAERQRRRATANDLRAMATRLRADSRRAVPGNATSEVSITDEFRDAATRLIHRSSIRFQDIAGLEQTRSEIQSAFALSLAKAPEGVHVPGMQSLLFYGPPGCGKTLLAAAVSNGLDATFFSVKVGDLMSRYFGDSPRLVQALYDEARSRGNSVIFLDEFDALATTRSGGDSSADRRLLVSLLTELDGLKEKDGGSQVLTIAATNRPWDLDEAILSRFEKSIHIPLPDAPARRRLLELNLKEQGYQVQVPEATLLQQTEGLSGREVMQLCKLMIEDMLQEANPNAGSLLSEGRAAIETYAIQIRPLQSSHLDRARARIQPRSTAESSELFRRWASDGLM